MENESTLTVQAAEHVAADTTHDTDLDATDLVAVVEIAEVVEELLIEEISIDGMCGVY